MKKEKTPRGATPKTAIAVVGLCLGAALLLFGSFGGTEAKPEAAEQLSADAYRQSIEETLTTLCASVRGAGKVTVFVSLSGGYEYVYSTDSEGECITVGNGSSERAVVEKINCPSVIGVGIVCEGAHDPRVAKAVSDLVCSSLGIGSNRVFITVGN